MHKAALKEKLAAGLLLQAGWQQQVKEALKSSSLPSPAVLVDPMIGSGSFLVEGAMIAADISPRIMRLTCGLVGSNAPPILRWKHDNQDAETLWKNILLQATTRAKQGLALLKQQQHQGDQILHTWFKYLWIKAMIVEIGNPAIIMYPTILHD